MVSLQGGLIRRTMMYPWSQKASQLVSNLSAMSSRRSFGLGLDTVFLINCVSSFYQHSERGNNHHKNGTRWLLWIGSYVLVYSLSTCTLLYIFGLWYIISRGYIPWYISCISGISLEYFWYISSISLEYLSGIFLVYLLYISSISLVYSGNYIISCTVLCPWRKI